MSSVVRRRRRREIKFLEGVIFCFAIVCFASVGRQAYHLYELREEAATIKARIEVLYNEKAELEAEKNQLHTAGYVEKIAREEYNMVGKNEMPVFIVGDEKESEKANK